MKKSDRFRIYRSRLHLLMTILIVVLPFVIISFLFNMHGSVFANLFTGLAYSVIRISVAYLIAVVLGGSLAMLIFAMGKHSDIALPAFDVLQSVPTFAVLPIAVSIWGGSDFTVIFFLILAIIWPIFFSTVSSLKLTRHDWVEAAEIFEIRGWLYFRKFLLPVSLPGIITGSIIGIGDGWDALIATEIIVGIQRGLGPFFELFKQDRAVTLFGVLGFLAIVFTINKLIWLPLLEWSHLRMEE